MGAISVTRSTGSSANTMSYVLVRANSTSSVHVSDCISKQSHRIYLMLTYIRQMYNQKNKNKNKKKTVAFAY